MLYGEPLQQVDWQAIEGFCARRIPEGTAVDYKAAWPADLAKTIAAMANTLGGLILIGVATDEQELPVAPVAGIEPQDRLELRVFDICEGSIFPPVIPEVKACPNADGTRCIVVIRVPISRQAHAVEKNTRVYVRTGNRNAHNELADVSKIEWLLGLRGGLERQRESLVKRTRERFAPMVVSSTRDPLPAGIFERHWLEMYAVPTFPSRELVADAGTLHRLATETVQHAEPGYGATFPPSLANGRGRHVHGGFGVPAYVAGQPALASYHEVTEHGLFYLRERVGHEHGYDEGLSVLWANFLAEHLHSFLYSASRLYSALNYRGPIELQFGLYGIDGREDLRYVPLHVALPAAGQRYWSPDPSITIDRSETTLDLDDHLIDIVIDVASRFDRAFGSTTPEETLRQFVEARDRALRGAR